jgi:hypothetical protein
LEVIFGSVFGTSKSKNPAYAPGFLLLKNRSKPQPAWVPLIQAPPLKMIRLKMPFSALPKPPDPSSP